MEYSEAMLVLQVGTFKECDMWLRLLSPSKGIISAFAFGGSRSKQRFPGCLDIFNNVFFRIKSESFGNYASLQEGVLLRGLSRLRTDNTRFGIARNCAKFLQAFGVGPEGASKAHFLLSSVLEALEESKEIPIIFPLFFRVRVAFDHGYSLSLQTCTCCGASLTESGGLLFVRDGLLVCHSCSSRYSGARVFLDADACFILETVRKEPPTLWGDIVLTPKSRSSIAMAIDGFIQYHIGLGWSGSHFVKV